MNTVLVVAEGHTERIYFQGLRTRNSTVRIITPSSRPTDPFRLVKLCIEQIGMQGIDIDNGDLAVCAFDIEGNDGRNLARAIKRASESKIFLAMTNPCFELWLLFHFTDVSSSVTCKEVNERLKKFIPGYSKTVDYKDLLGPQRKIAMERADHHCSHGERHKMRPFNPGTSMHLVLQRVDALIERNIRI
ncbi:MAG: RloB domain-containing protein [Methanomassiliicoccales archaeon]|nr:RloB domain-containing protein [Methanomassiliicoccales archaeon]